MALAVVLAAAAVGSGDFVGAAPHQSSVFDLDAANRARLADDLAAGRHPAVARRVDDYLTTVAEHRDHRTGAVTVAALYAYEPDAFGGDGRVVVVVGDLDAADHVVVTVGGLLSQGDNVSPHRPLAIHDEARRWTDDAVAVVDWLGYDPPSADDGFGDAAALLDRAATESGAELLAGFVAERRAGRSEREDQHVTAIGNSYGATVVAIAADRHDLAVDDVVLVASPGAGFADHADDLVTGADHTWVGSASHDFVTFLGTTGATDPTELVAAVIPGVEVLGRDPAEDRFGARRFRAESVARNDASFSVGWDDVFAGDWASALDGTAINGVNLDDHGRYFDPGTESLRNIGAIVAGRGGDVLASERRYDPLLDVTWGGGFTFPDVDAGVQDPERDRQPDGFDPDGARP